METNSMSQYWPSKTGFDLESIWGQMTQRNGRDEGDSKQEKYIPLYASESFISTTTISKVSKLAARSTMRRLGHRTVTSQCHATQRHKETWILNESTSCHDSTKNCWSGYFYLTVLRHYHPLASFLTNVDKHNLSRQRWKQFAKNGLIQNVW